MQPLSSWQKAAEAWRHRWPNSSRRPLILMLAVAGVATGVALLTFLSLQSAPSPAAPLGQPAAAAALPRPESTVGEWSLGLDVALKLLAVVLLIYISATLVKRYVLRAPALSGGLVRVLDAATLAPRKAIYVVEVGDKVLVLGATDTSLALLTEISDPDEVARLVATHKEPGLGFQRYLDRSLGQAVGQNFLPADPLDGAIRRLSEAVSRVRKETGTEYRQRNVEER